MERPECCSAHLLARYLLGCLSDRRAQIVQGHLATCDECRSLLQAIDIEESAEEYASSSIHPALAYALVIVTVLLAAALAAAH